MFDLAQSRDIPGLVKLWSTCFGDREETVQAFFRRMFDGIQVFIARQKGSIASMLCALPTTYVDDTGESFPAAYFYAVCTAPQFRRKGLAAGLMAHAETRLKSQGVALVALVPQSKPLISYYEALNYRPMFYYRQGHTAAKPQGKVTVIDGAAYRNLREMQLYERFLSQDERYLECQPGLYRIELEDQICCAAAIRDGNTAKIYELLPERPEAAATLAEFMGCTAADYRTEGHEHLFGLAKCLDARLALTPSYLGLALE